MKRIVFKTSLVTILICLHFNVICFSQGGWDLGYIPIDSIEEDWVGKEVKLDFKASSSDVISNDIKAINIRYLLAKNDTIKLNVNDIEKTYVENWNLHVDQGFLNDQNLMAVKSDFMINEIFLESMNDSLITVKMHFYKSKRCKSKKSSLKDTKSISIDRTIIKGVLFRRNE